ncbi:MAG: Gfo/Idh/MocA family oxidoreductase [Deltaproteobacteria bacterium]|nr:Gfo/Idh/MocA family oxidoreductase [Deltaproteobacteria bacterium]
MLKTAVVGVGHLGRYHAEKYSKLPGVDLIGVVDICKPRADSVAEQLGVHAYYDFRDLIGHVDLVSVAVPTENHFAVAQELLSAGIHVLLEKPLTRTLDEADQLIDLAHKHNLVLQAGHLERFNPTVQVVMPSMGRPLFIEADRISVFPQRGTDVDVVLDLMIHDIDLTLALAGGSLKWLHAVGVAVLTPRVDIANARLEFDNGCVANLTASRVSIKNERKFRVFLKDAYWSLDLGQRRAITVGRTPSGADAGREIAGREVTIPPLDALEEEIKSFIQAVITKTPPLVTGEDGRRALDVALKIMDAIKIQRQIWFPELTGDEK